MTFNFSLGGKKNILKMNCTHLSSSDRDDLEWLRFRFVFCHISALLSLLAHDWRYLVTGGQPVLLQCCEFLFLCPTGLFCHDFYVTTECYRLSHKV